MNNRVEMKVLSPEERINNFEEVAQGYSLEEAIMEASRCLNCKTKPCVNKCPVNIDIPSFIKEIKGNNINEAYKVITNNNLLPGICGRVCPQETQCESSCVRGIKGEPIAIGRLERFVSDNHHEEKQNDIQRINGKIAIIGSGPAGLACSGVLISKGYQVDVYEAMHKNGGVLIYGIPEFRLPKKIVLKEINNLKSLGVNFINDVVVGKTITLEELYEQYDAVFIGTGAGLPKFMGIPGENANGVLSANEFLTRINLMKAYKDEYFTPVRKMKNVAVVGGGNVAMDAARCAKRLKANVYLVYRRGLEEMPARKEEILNALEEKIEFKNLCNPVEILYDENKNVTGIKCQEMILGEADESGRRKAIPKENSYFTLDVDTVIMAIGNHPNPLLKNSTDLVEYNKYGCLVVDENGRTNIDKIYGGGDVVTGAATVILAMEAGKKSAIAIDKILNKKK